MNNTVVNFIEQYKGLMIVGASGYIIANLKNIWSSVQEIVKKKLSYSISFNSDNENLYQTLMEVIKEMKPSIFNRHILYNADRYTSLADYKELINVGVYTIFDKNKYIRLTVSSQEAKAPNGGNTSVNYTIHLTCYGNFKSLKAKLDEAIQKKVRESANNNHIQFNTKNSCNFLTKRTFDSVYNRVVVDKIKTAIDTWVQNKEFYIKNGMQYKIGILFHGDPGTGKSTLAKAIASYVDAKIMYDGNNCLNGGMESMGNHYGSSIVKVVLFEDIDCMFDLNRTDDGAENDMKAMFSYAKESFREVLNILDGPLSPTNTIFIATTNHLEKLDPALVRPGRFDICIEVGNIDRCDAIAMCKGFDCNPDEILCGEKFPMNPAKLQSKILNHVNNKLYSVV